MILRFEVIFVKRTREVKEGENIRDTLVKHEIMSIRVDLSVHGKASILQ
jgi:hypothetical protein